MRTGAVDFSFAFIGIGFWLSKSKNNLMRLTIAELLFFCSKDFTRMAYSIFWASSWLAYSSSGSGKTFITESCNEMIDDAEYKPTPLPE